MKNICFMDWDYSIVGGIGKVLNNIASKLSQYDDKYKVYVLSVCRKYDNNSYELPSNVSYDYLNKGTLRIRSAITKSFFPLLRYLSKNKIDVVFLMGHYTVPVALFVSRFVKTKFVFCDHGAISNQLNDKTVTNFRKIASKKFDKVITLTDRNKSDYMNLFNAKEEKLQRIYNWLDSDIFNYSSSEYDEGSKSIITVGRFTSEKGLDMLVDVAKIVFERHPDWKWDVYGDGEIFDEIKEKVKILNLESNVFLKGLERQVYEKYKNYAIYVLTSYREGLPLALLEAKANKLPIVSFDCVTGPGEIVVDGKDGFLVSCYDKNEMANKICKLIEDSVLRKSFSNNSLSNMDKFNEEKILNEWVELIEGVR